ncbi:MAG: hypothetical protein ACI915_001302 [Gammaproteobacteria bacterium]|jgi:hypothetical protein
MKAQHVALGLTALAVLSLPLAANAHDDGGGKNRSFDVCVNPLVDFALGDNDGSGTPTAGDTFTAVGGIYPKGSVPEGAPPFDDCSGVVADRIGTFYTNGHFVRPLDPADPAGPGFPGAAADDLALVTWHFLIDGQGSVDTIGPVKAVADGRSYPQTVVGGTGRFKGSKGTAKTTSLGGGGFQFSMKIPK